MNRIRRAEGRALAFLKKHGITEPPVDVEALARAEGATVRYEDLGETTSGLMVRRGDNRVAIGVNSEHHSNRQRFTIAHEIGHWLMHAKTPTVIIDDLMVHFRDDGSEPGANLKEMEANAFAASLLMPRDWLCNDLVDRWIDCNDDAAIRALALRYRVSAQALAFRLQNLGLIGGLPTAAQ